MSILDHPKETTYRLIEGPEQNIGRIALTRRGGHLVQVLAYRFTKSLDGKPKVDQEKFANESAALAWIRRAVPGLT